MGALFSTWIAGVLMAVMWLMAIDAAKSLGRPFVYTVSVLVTVYSVYAITNMGLTR